MPHAPDPIDEQALEWVIRLRDPDFAQWEEFDAWLGAEPAHARAYHAVAAADAGVADLLAAAPPPAQTLSVATPRRFEVGRRVWLGGALAASILAAVGIAVTAPGSSPYAVETAPGARRTVALADGSRIELNGATRLTLDRERPRFATLERGEAAFTVVHDAADPFRVDVGDARLLDAGTVFNVARGGGVTVVAVAEGAVVYNPDREAVSLSSGRSLRAVDGDTRLVVAEVDTGGIAAWREGRLVYQGTPLTQVAEDLSRNLGLRIVAAPEVAHRTFRGVIAFDRDREGLMRRLGPLLGVRVRAAGQGWILTATMP